MSDPKKNFQCTKCGYVLNDKDRHHGNLTQCPVCRLNKAKLTKPKDNTMITKVEAFKANNGTLHETEELAIENNNIVKSAIEKKKIKDVIQKFNAITSMDFINYLYNHNVRVVEDIEIPNKFSEAIKLAISEFKSINGAHHNLEYIIDDVNEIVTKLEGAIS